MENWSVVTRTKQWSEFTIVIIFENCNYNYLDLEISCHFKACDWSVGHIS